MRTVTWTATVEIEVLVDDEANAVADLAHLYGDIWPCDDAVALTVGPYGFDGKLVGLRRDDLIAR